MLKKEIADLGGPSDQDNVIKKAVLDARNTLNSTLGTRAKGEARGPDERRGEDGRCAQCRLR